MLANSLNKYNKRTIETSKVIEELIKLAKEMDGAYKLGEDNGMVKRLLKKYGYPPEISKQAELIGEQLVL
nr:type I restriction enzyme endonuclease domain-containing protein [Macrococcus caseolyticus]